MSGQQVEIPVNIKLFGEHVQCAPEATWISVITSVWQFVQERAVSVFTLLGTFAAIYLGKVLFCNSYLYLN